MKNKKKFKKFCCLCWFFFFFFFFFFGRVNWIWQEYGGIYPNGSKTGLFKKLDDHELDGTQHNFKFSHQRADHFDYIFPGQLAE